MRVTFVLPYAGLAGGIRVASVYARELHRRGHEVTVVSTPAPREDLRGRLRRLVKTGYGASGETPHGHFEDVPFEHRVVDNGRQTIEAKHVPDADVVVSTWWQTALWADAFGPEKGRHVHFIQHDETQFDYQDPREVEVTWGLDTYKLVVAHWLKKLAVERYDVRDVAVVPNGVDLNQFRAPPRGKRSVSRFGVMYAVSTFKGLDVAVEAFRTARRSESQIEFVAFGVNPPDEHLPLPEGAEYHQAPAQDAIKDIYASCDAWIFNSRSEGFGLPLLEAMACRTPVIATPAGAAPELVGGGGGLLIEHESPNATADAILDVVRMPTKEWRDMSDAAYATALRHTWDACYETFERHLLNAAAGRRPGDVVPAPPSDAPRPA